MPNFFEIRREDMRNEKGKRRKEKSHAEVAQLMSVSK